VGELADPRSSDRALKKKAVREDVIGQLPISSEGADSRQNFEVERQKTSMVISHRHKYLYFVAPKCASATVRHSLRNFTDFGSPVTKYVKYKQHVTIAKFLSSEHGALFNAGYLRFSFVRNPYDRLYSAYVQDRNDVVRPVRTRSWQRWWSKRKIFNRIGDDFNRYVTEYLRHAKTRDDWVWINFCPIHAFTHLHGECVMDFLGRAEDVEGSLAELSTRLGIEIEKTENRNVRVQPIGGQLKYLHHYNRQSLEVVNELYREDFEYFGYQMFDHVQDAPLLSRMSA